MKSLKQSIQESRSVNESASDKARKEFQRLLRTNAKVIISWEDEKDTAIEIGNIIAITGDGYAMGKFVHDEDYQAGDAPSEFKISPAEWSKVMKLAKQ